MANKKDWKSKWKDVKGFFKSLEAPEATPTIDTGISTTWDLSTMNYSIGIDSPCY